MLTPQETIRKYAAAWLEQDAGERMRLLEQAWADNGELVTPETSIKGREALSRHIGRFIEESADTTPLINGVVEEHHGVVRFDWRIIAPDIITVADNVCFGELADDGRLRRIVTFIGLRPGEVATNGEKASSEKRYTMNVRKLTKEDIQQKLAHFESKHGMTSREFYGKYNSCQLEENLDWLDWAWYYELAYDAGLVSLDMESAT
jgi:hypothetical protein